LRSWAPFVRRKTMIRFECDEQLYFDVKKTAVLYCSLEARDRWNVEGSLCRVDTPRITACASKQSEMYVDRKVARVCEVTGRLVKENLVARWRVWQ
jgi:hypothetical protein